MVIDVGGTYSIATYSDSNLPVQFNTLEALCFVRFQEKKNIIENRDFNAFCL